MRGPNLAVEMSERSERYREAVRWADGWNIFPSDGPGSKKPAVKYGKYVGDRAKTISAADRKHYAALAAMDDGEPLLSLENASGGWSLCIIDIDDESQLPAAEAWWSERGVELWSTYHVKTSRGYHFYFLRELGLERSYKHLDHASAGGLLGKKAMDLKSHGQLVTCPGAKHASGITYTGNWPGTLRDIVTRMANANKVMPLWAWKEALEKRTKASESRVLVEKNTPEWRTVVADGRERQNLCPWCGSTSSRILSYSHTKGTARCWSEDITRSIYVGVKHAVKTGTIVAEPTVRSDTENQEWRTIAKYLRASARYAEYHGYSNPDYVRAAIVEMKKLALNEAAIAPPEKCVKLYQNTLHLYSFTQNSCGGIADTSNAHFDEPPMLYTHRTPCFRGITAIMKGGTSIHTSCWNMTCPVCGPRMVRGMMEAAREELAERLADERVSGTPMQYGTAELQEVPRLSLDGGWWMSTSPRPGTHRMLVAWPQGARPPKIILEPCADPTGWWLAAVGAYDVEAWGVARTTETLDADPDPDEDIGFEAPIQKNQSRVNRGSDSSPLGGIIALRGQVVGKASPPLLPGTQERESKLLIITPEPHETILKVLEAERGIKARFMPRKQNNSAGHLKTVYDLHPTDGTEITELEGALAGLVRDGELRGFGKKAK